MTDHPKLTEREVQGPFRCPDYSNGSDLIGCGGVFDDELDWEGWADCPHCGLAFKPNENDVAARVSK